MTEIIYNRQLMQHVKIIANRTFSRRLGVSEILKISDNNAAITYKYL